MNNPLNLGGVPDYQDFCRPRLYCFTLLRLGRCCPLWVFLVHKSIQKGENIGQLAAHTSPARLSYDVTVVIVFSQLLRPMEHVMTCVPLACAAWRSYWPWHNETWLYKRTHITFIISNCNLGLPNCFETFLKILPCVNGKKISVV